MNIWNNETAAWPVANPVVTCASASVTGIPSNFVADPFLYRQVLFTFLFSCFLIQVVLFIYVLLWIDIMQLVFVDHNSHSAKKKKSVQLVPQCALPICIWFDFKLLYVRKMYNGKDEENSNSRILVCYVPNFSTAIKNSFPLCDLIYYQTLNRNSTLLIRLKTVNMVQILDMSKWVYKFELEIYCSIIKRLGEGIYRGSSGKSVHLAELESKNRRLDLS